MADGHLNVCPTCGRKPVFRRSLEERFWNKVRIGSEHECWEYQGHLNKSGYGIFGVWSPRSRQHRTVLAHRQAYALWHGAVPKDLCVRHKCDNRACCNPAHLVPGTQLDNMTDMVERGRNTSVLTESQVIAIREAYLNGAVKQKTLAAMLGVTRAAISSAIKGKNWRRLGTPETEKLRIAYRRGRASGESHPASKLSDEEVRAIRRAYAAGGMTQKELARAYGIKQPQVSAIILERSRATAGS